MALGWCWSPDAQLRNDDEGSSGSSSRERKASSEALVVTHTRTLMPSTVFFPQPQPVMGITGDLTAAAGASAKTGPFATPSRGLATALQASGAGAARTAVSRAPTVMTATRDASARTAPPAITLQGNAAAHRDTLEPCK